MKFAVLPNPSRDGAVEITKGICFKLKELGADCVLTEKIAGLEEFECADCDSAVSGSDCVIAVGGDATIIHAAKAAAANGKRILGVNAGRLAFMAGLEGHELDLLCRLISGEYTVDSRLILKAEIRNDKKVVSTDYCVNDVYISSGSGPRLENINVSLGDKLINTYLADGVLVATPTGSTAYSLSAGGSVVDPELESILLTPVCSHSLFDRPIIFRPNAVLTVSSNENTPLRISMDGKEFSLLEPGFTAVISRAEFKAEFIRIKSDNFLDILSTKLAQRKGVS